MADVQGSVPQRCVLLAGHNVGFDLAVVGSELWRLGRHDQARALLAHPAACTGALCKLLLGGFRRLGELYSELTGNELEGAHNALADTEACAVCLQHLCAIDRAAQAREQQQEQEGAEQEGGAQGAGAGVEAGQRDSNPPEEAGEAQGAAAEPAPPAGPGGPQAAPATQEEDAAAVPQAAGSPSEVPSRAPAEAAPAAPVEAAAAAGPGAGSHAPSDPEAREAADAAEETEGVEATDAEQGLQEQEQAEEEVATLAPVVPEAAPPVRGVQETPAPTGQSDATGGGGSADSGAVETPIATRTRAAAKALATKAGPASPVSQDKPSSNRRLPWPVRPLPPPAHMPSPPLLRPAPRGHAPHPRTRDLTSPLPSGPPPPPSPAAARTRVALAAGCSEAGVPRPSERREYDPEPYPSDLKAYDQARLVSLSWTVLGPPPALEALRSAFLWFPEDGPEQGEALDGLLADLGDCELIATHKVEFHVNVIALELYRRGRPKDAQRPAAHGLPQVAPPGGAGDAGHGGGDGAALQLPRQGRPPPGKRPRCEEAEQAEAAEGGASRTPCRASPTAAAATATATGTGAAPQAPGPAEGGKHHRGGLLQPEAKAEVKAEVKAEGQAGVRVEAVDVPPPRRVCRVYHVYGSDEEDDDLLEVWEAGGEGVGTPARREGRRAQAW
ncbi:hypothetical protein HYH03_015344 [Edaphochlamys debaryana]|uniref:Exonuclease domain-containing protein n=1 Tax=Edaphochlamys debaryana TaxID=47281 RepID=A0A835XU01_9CHLO|nr:hypothetical protein HYH03_015344 [Edaphochlamys debaryana]|eukprot:KAG2485899.1 hypothetical protein HYH03_015344 [Edaphochlamys debaryana]